jgi:hypothetical protein
MTIHHHHDIAGPGATGPAAAPPSGTGGRGHHRPPWAALALGVALLAGVLGAWPSAAGATVYTTATVPSPAKKVIHAPIGYLVSTRSGVTNGPISPADFDSTVGTGSAAAFGYVGGDDVTYDSTATAESIEVTLFSFHSPAGATAFEAVAETQWGASSQAPSRRTIRSIRGSTVEVATTPTSDGFYPVDAFARKGDTLMVIEYTNTPKPTGVPQPLAAAAVAQYRRL